MNISMAQMNFRELFILNYQNEKTKPIHYFQPRIAFKGKNLCYFDIRNIELDVNVLDDQSFSKEFKYLDELYIFNSSIYDALVGDNYTGCMHTMLKNMLRVIEIYGISKHFMFWLDFMNEESILSNLLNYETLADGNDNISQNIRKKE